MLPIGHLTEEESLFNYTIGNTSYSAINDDYLTHQPLYYDDLNITQDVRDTCQGNRECIYDSLTTRNMALGVSTLGISELNDQIIQTLGRYSL